MISRFDTIQRRWLPETVRGWTGWADLGDQAESVTVRATCAKPCEMMRGDEDKTPGKGTYGAVKGKGRNIRNVGARGSNLLTSTVPVVIGVLPHALFEKLLLEFFNLLNWDDCVFKPLWEGSRVLARVLIRTAHRCDVLGV